MASLASPTSTVASVLNIKIFSYVNIIVHGLIGPMTVNITTFSMTTFSIMTFKVTTL
jgi:hypothetical protein